MNRRREIARRELGPKIGDGGFEDPSVKLGLGPRLPPVRDPQGNAELVSNRSERGSGGDGKGRRRRRSAFDVEHRDHDSLINGELSLGYGHGTERVFALI
ncbi:MAG TPA: hypothetical protein VMS11_04755 [Solirubrobacterales bacterium]|nr:hypothetical protein [Solirubrobacterales bacterium]